MANAIKAALTAERKRLQSELKKVERSLIGLFGERKTMRRRKTAGKGAAVSRKGKGNDAVALKKVIAENRKTGKELAGLEAKRKRAQELKQRGESAGGLGQPV